VSVALFQSSVIPKQERLSHDEACGIARQVLRDLGPRTVVIDMRNAREITTAAFARLVLLRRRLRAQGGDLHLSNLRGKAASLYQINRLDAVLPLH
jgi:anti-anti-sigma regulatory factor